MVDVRVSVALFLIILSVNFDEIVGNCTVAKGRRYCDDLNDLYTYNYSQRILQVEKPNDTEFQSLQPVCQEVADRIGTLKIFRTLDELPDDAFVNFTRIIQIHLVGNKFNHIPSESFRGLTTLLYLVIAENDLGKVPAGIFNGSLMQHLTIESAGISEIENGAFFNMMSLHTLILKNNLIKSFNALQYVTRASFLQNLKLEFNMITQVSRFMLEGLTRLSHLNLAHNRITLIEPLSFDETPLLRVLVLSHNFLKTMTGQMLPPVGHLRMDKLLLDHNKLTYLPSNFLFRIESLEKLSIGGNPWQCPCLDLILRWLNDNEVKLWCDDPYFSGDRPVCLMPPFAESCTYRYEEDFVRDYNATRSLYPAVEECETW